MITGSNWAVTQKPPIYTGDTFRASALTKNKGEFNHQVSIFVVLSSQLLSLSVFIKIIRSLHFFTLENGDIIHIFKPCIVKCQTKGPKTEYGKN
jgi:hypothetical protein